MSESPTIRPYADTDAANVRTLFISVNRELAPAGLRETFEAYIAHSLAEEMDRIGAYYAEHAGGFWIAEKDAVLVGMFGLEATGTDAMELRRMYVAASSRRGGVARAMLRFAEDECRRRGVQVLELSTSELQPAALAFYRSAGYRLVREVVAEQASNKTVGRGIRRYHFAKSFA